MASTQSVSLGDMGDPLKPFAPQNETPEDRRQRIMLEKEARKRSEAIDKQIKAEKEQLEKQKVAKLLLLGSSESGKTTVLKQLKIIHGKGLEDERNQYRRIVYLNILTAMKALTSALANLGYTLDPKNLVHLQKFSKLNSVKDSLNRNSISVQAAIQDAKLDDDAFQLFTEHAEGIIELWKDSAIRKAYKHASEIGLQDSAKYFLDNVERFAQKDYLPTDEDILQARVRTIGVSEHKFEIDGVTYKIYDVGGHRSQRHFWAPYFDDVNAIIFMAAISAFDQPLEEDPNVNRMIDILKHKLTLVDLKDYFPDFKGENKFSSVTRFFQKKFGHCNKNKDKRIYVHFTHATDTKQMRVIVATVNDIVQRVNLKASGLI
ncbi:17930_t:CDS:2 [Funneliformis caledonium]|uniref:17930_t:CDS:1 n=1 Tax=Funneliformis caledonium TaxID=1117310 RepID=A0A9N9CE65_9GLOM|nr:17930_t:CDS:2 [Funneliformis caledonium]